MNDAYFTDPKRPHTYLKVRGFDAMTGARSGGIKDPVLVGVAAGAVLLRTYQDPARLFGEWWFTPWEIMQVVSHFAREGAAFAEGRPQGKGILQATLAVRHEWGGKSADHLGLVAAVRLTKPLKAFFGEGDVAPDASQTRNLKPVQIGGPGGRRGVRQVFLPEAWTYMAAFDVIERDCQTDADLIRLARTHGSRLPFET